MKKYIFINIFAVFAFVLPSFVFADADVLTGDKRTACEVILCLSSSAGRGISECQAPLRKYFSISAKKFSDTIKKRRKFLDLCPAANENAKMSALTTAIQNQEYACDAETLNNRTDSIKRYVGGRYYRTQARLPAFCEAMYDHEFTDLKKPKYVCDSKKWYKKIDWERGYELVEVSKKWNRKTESYDKEYKKVPIKKDCWE